MTATQWQHSLYPAEYQAKLHVLHEGIDTQIVAPDLNARLRLPNAGIELTLDDEVVTYVSVRAVMANAGSNGDRVSLGRLENGSCRRSDTR